MKNNVPAWKRFTLIAAVAFLVGLLPYFFLLLNVEAGELPLGTYLLHLGQWLWGRIVAYAPHILTIYIFAVGALIFLEGRNPDRTILWLMTLALLPIVGIALYLFLGPDLKRIERRKLFRPTRSYPAIVTPIDKQYPARVEKTSILAYRNSASEIMERCAVRVLIDGEETFSAILAALRGAKRYIHIEYFIFKDDRLGHEIADILCERAAAGVRVRMTTDAVGSWKLGRKFIERLHKAGVACHTFMPVSFPFFHSSINFRNHRKIVVVDGDIAFTGGLNVGTEYLGEGPLGFWRDTHAAFRGDAVYALNEIFLRDWRIASGESLAPDDPVFAPTDPEACMNLPFLPMQIVESGSSSAWHAIQQMYLMMISEAKQRIWITSPYLVPGEAIFNALQVAALAGIDVRLLIPAQSDHFLVYWAGRSNIEELLRAGVRIWRYGKGFVHAKTLVMDDLICSVGTANLDNRSLEINFEVQAFIYDRELSETFAQQFLKDIMNAEECLLREWEKRPLPPRFLEAVGRLWTSQI
jgi:Phosphatidylserine/phosphatidylglycerophosphate/cardiolipin synthases and related enzymes